MPIAVFAQGVRYDLPPILGQNGLPLHNVGVTLCPGTATITGGSTCSPGTQSFTDITLGTQCASGLPVTLPGSNVCKATSDAFGNAGFWLSPGAYIYCLNGPGISGTCYNLTVPAGSTPAGISAVKKIQDVGLSLIAYGADPTGVADSTTAINNAIADSVTTGLPILCDGTFKITATLSNIDPQFTTMIGYKTCTITAGAVMTNMVTIGGTAPPPYDKGFMANVLWEGNNNAAHALQLGCSGVSCSTQFVNGMLFLGVRVKNTTGDGIQTGNNVWNVGWVNGSSANNGGNGMTIQTGNNAGESTSFSNFHFSNNAGTGLVVQNSGTGGGSYVCNACDFGQNQVAQIQNGTSAGNGNPFMCSGCHFEWNSLLTTTRDIINFGDFVCSGCFFTGGTGNSTYRVDNEHNLTLTGGTINNAGTGTYFNSAQAGTTTVNQVGNYAIEAVVNFATDTSGNMSKVASITVQGSAANAVSVPNGGINAGGFIVTGSGFKPTGAGGQTAVSGDGTNVLLPKAFLTSQYTNSTTSFTNVTGGTNLAFSVAANTNYVITCHLYYQAAATGGLNIEFTGPASPTSVAYGLNLPVSATAVGGDGVATAFGTSLGSAVTTAATNFDAIVSLQLANGANAGTVQLLAKSSAAVQLQIQVGSYCVAQ